MFVPPDLPHAPLAAREPASAPHSHRAHTHTHEAGAHAHSHHHGHSHGPDRRHPAARPGLSLIRLSVWQRLAIVLPIAALVWAMVLAVVAGAGA